MLKMELNYDGRLDSVQSIMTMILDNNVNDCIGVIYAKNILKKMKLNCHDRFDRVRFMTQSRRHNDVIDTTGAVYAENETEVYG